MSGDNLNTFMGLLWTQSYEHFGVLWHHGIRSSLKAIIYNEEQAVPDDFRLSFLKDVVAVSRKFLNCCKKETTLGTGAVAQHVPHPARPAERPHVSDHAVLVGTTE
jgi:hypothetical protein